MGFHVLCTSVGTNSLLLFRVFLALLLCFKIFWIFCSHFCLRPSEKHNADTPFFVENCSWDHIFLMEKVLCLLQKRVSIRTEKSEKWLFKLFYFPKKEAIGSECIFKHWRRVCGSAMYRRNLNAVCLFFILALLPDYF